MMKWFTIDFKRELKNSKEWNMDLFQNCINSLLHLIFYLKFFLGDIINNFIFGFKRFFLIYFFIDLVIISEKTVIKKR